MKQVFLASACAALLSLGLAARAAQAPSSAPSAAPAPRAAAARPVSTARAAAATPTMVAAEQTRLVTTYCATCHSDRGKAGGLSLAS